ncbi:putative phospholipase B-like 2 [Haliotis rufescens]|uniref:putative phospholipase B-like 2 n=1 Tax=Haliotis rufescens TaxID=6454 RepID=UPI00201EA264|nr:putative phospholipase B-like 2 [Haliotis rufescens]
MATAVHVVVLAVLLSVVAGEAAQPVTVHAVYNATSGRFQVLEGNATVDSLAWAQFINSVNETGWGYLEVSTQYNDTETKKYNDSMLAYAAGLVEGYVTRDLIKMHWENTMAGYCDKPYSAYCQRLRDFLETNLNWIRTSIKNNTDDTYWHQVEMFYTQLRGMSDGYSNDPQRPSLDIDPFGLYMFQISNDLRDLEVALNKTGVRGDQPRRGHCTAYIKVDLEWELLYAAHNTWTSYTDMLRVLKKYTLQYSMTDAWKGLLPKGSVWTFSSYPGYLVSSDDFYVLSSWLVTMATTIPNNNPALYQHTKPEGCVLTPVRVWAANRLAETGQEWVLTFIRYNSGTYNNQWMIVDQKLVQGNLPPAVLTIVEQMPGYIEFADVTDLLIVNTYWASYNVPFFPTIFNISGQQKLVDKYGDYFSYNMSRRAQIMFQQDSTVQDRNTLFNFMRYNDFQHDPLSKCNCTPGYSADLAIAARDDLNEENGTYLYDDLAYAMGGAIDVKIVATGEMQWLLFYAVSGPTSFQQPPFQWSKVKDAKKYPHFGQPDLFNFKPVSFNGTAVPPSTPSWYKET